MSSTTALQAKSASPRRAALLVLELKPAVYAAAWFLIVAFHAACGVYLICVAMTYWFLTTGTMPFYAAIWSLQGTTNYHFYSVVFGIVGAMHGIRVLLILIASIRARRLTLRSDSGIIPGFVSNRFQSSHLGRSAQDSPPRLSGTLIHAWNSVFSRQGLFGVESEHFSTVFSLREVLEASSQTYQAYRASSLLPRAELNAIIVGLLVTNCWTTAAIQFFLRRAPALERVVTLTYDATISFCMMEVVPLIIFVPYVQAFHIEYQAFKDTELMYNPVGVTKLVLENRLIFVAGLFDFGTKLIPQLSIFLALVTVSELLGSGDVKVIPGAGGQSIQSLVVRPKDGNSTAEKPKTAKAVDSGSSEHGGGLSVLSKYRHIISITVFLVWGAVVILLHGLAAQRAANYEVVGCRAVTRPWFSNGKEPCSSLVYDCNAHNTASPDETSFDTLDEVALATLAIVNCPALEMPTEIHNFNNLIMLVVYNSTIVSWDAESAISATIHIRLLSVFVGRTNMTEVPQGLLQPLPATLLSMQFSETNLTALPTDLYVRWHALAVIAFENGILTEIPYQMFFSPVYTLSFMNNRLETIPTLAMMPPGMIIPQLQLKHNPLRELPATLMAPNPVIMSLNVEQTQLTAMPEWVKTNTQVVWASDTPFCQAPLADPTLAYQVMCSPRSTGQEEHFPKVLFDRLFLIDREEQELA
ncbi:hypothetical protein PHYPSEUDO_013181 [Phytophthora pseudosyringae]|uniref:Uncharacterized protein n=1 Tax=Phytophthora pseudosyringae TaxID=221518 RepID=A0A8T1W2F6_9STRA|nr:hypothetical protein PHYPSEUDO_013181 [Phytophthora pseudosyringae]